MKYGPAFPVELRAEGLPELLRAEEVAELLRMGRSTFFRYDKTGRVPRAVWIGNLKRYRRDEVVAWCRAGCPPRERWEEMYR
jgi:predicted DNA-binding transcriptional regulator AlpA